MSIDKPFKPSENEKSKSLESNKCLTVKEARKALSALYHATVTVIRMANECAKEGNARVYFKIDGDETEYSALL